MDKPQGRLIFRPSIRLPDGKRIYAWQYGKKAFPIWIPDDVPERDHDPEKPGR